MALFNLNYLRKLSSIPRCIGIAKTRNLTNWTKFNEFTYVSEEISEALKNGDPVVALESTIISHGMPYPDNLKTALEAEATARTKQVIPATIGISRGRVYVGMDENQIDELAKKETSPAKVSRRDLPAVLAKGLSGGTTVSGTMIVCNIVGIKIFATGGIGGVHRGGETTLDISADLTELGRTPVAVVSAGVKSILDVRKTLEYLETQGVCVATYGDSKDFPNFFTPVSNCFSPWNVRSPGEAAALLVSRDELGLSSGILFAVPIPEEHAAEGLEIEKAIQQSVIQAQSQGITGNDVTPHILKSVNDITEGKSVKSNIALIKNNVAVASEILIALSRFQKEGNSTDLSQFSPFIQKKTSLSQKDRPVVIGGSVVDFVASVTESEIKMDGSTHKGRIRQSCGGVGRNVADCITRLGFRPLLISAIGHDLNGDNLLAYNPKMDSSGIKRLTKHNTATYCAILDKDGACKFGIGDMSIHSQIDIKQIQHHEMEIISAPMVILDGNIPTDTLNYVIGMCKDKDVPVWYEPTDINKAGKPFESDAWKELSFVSPNLAELRAIYHTLKAYNSLAEVTPGNSCELSSITKECARLASPLLDHLSSVIVTLGAQGLVILTSKDGILGSKKDITVEPKLLYYEAPSQPVIESVSGAGDCLVGGIVSGLLHQASDPIPFGLQVAALSLESYHAVPPTITAKHMQVKEDNFKQKVLHV